MLEDEKRALVTHARQLYEDGLNGNLSGNLSCRRDAAVAITPSGVPYRTLSESDVVLVDRESGAVREGETPSSELPMHLAVYEARPDVGALVHTHSPFATVLACLGRPIEPVHNSLALLGGSIRVAPYATSGTEALGTAAVEALGDRQAVLLENHGVLVGGSDLAEATFLASTVEFCAKIQYFASLFGDPETLSDEAIEEIQAQYRSA
jgi:L-fuculose-phosphate aldolase